MEGDMIKLIIKGNPSEARVAADLHGVSLAFAHRGGDAWRDETIAGAHDGRMAVAMWFAEGPASSPFPVGTLLWYGD
jgi:hypothetical protein